MAASAGVARPGGLERFEAAGARASAAQLAAREAGPSGVPWDSNAALPR
eukprot:CAMPEP_0206052280 /NCGR_PEP_ID=MMETSP1466-20131121/33409_1 /ASSEMBLY_ACC=CAM_ASM_001126 /TAXON_ID=44452 /ORGANISM="Pavlova gyrans, Strain CCMP608" /LENGTH=48 /DNA_ID= /DNA_START= /DNA_END= /DNA_ORIENTATION=